MPFHVASKIRPAALQGRQGLLTVGNLPLIQFRLYDWIGRGLDGVTAAVQLCGRTSAAAALSDSIGIGPQLADHRASKVFSNGRKQAMGIATVGPEAVARCSKSYRWSM